MSEETITVETEAATPEVDVTIETKPAEDPRISKANKEAAEYRKRLRQTEAELAKFREAQMTETEKAAAEAEKRGRASAMTEFGQRLVRAEFKALAAGKIPDIDAVLDDLNLSKFVGEDGEPDTKAIGRAIERLAPAPPETDNSRAPGPRPDLSQGGSRQNMALNSDALTDALKAAVGAA